MELYRVLLVDDEEDIRVGISQKMDWAGLGFELVGEAENGKDALDLAESLRPDVVLTDIKMPFMDGLELCRILTERLPASKFVVFSGFDDFEYAKQAIQMNVSEYILKPINAVELASVLQKLKEQLDRERTERQNAALLRSRYEESLPLIRGLFLTRLLDGRVPRNQVGELAERYGVVFTGKAFAAAIVHIGGDREHSALLIPTVQQLLDENLTQQDCVCRTFLYNDALAMLAEFQHKEQVYTLIEVLNRVCTLAESYLGYLLTIGVGMPCDDPADLPQSTAGARSALDYRSMVGRGQAIYIGDLEPGAVVRITFGEGDERALTAAVKMGGEEEVRTEVSRLADRLRDRLTEANVPLSQCQLFFLSLLTCLLKMTRDGGLKTEKVFGEDFNGTMQVTDFASVEELAQWCLDRCLNIQTGIRRQRTDSAGRMVEKAKDFIREHYAESQLSVEMLCEYLHLSPAYFSTIFKRQMGMSFTGYVTVVRMEAAAERLRNTEEKTYLIARACGYEDPNYFSYVFKRHFGMSPTKYRASGQNS